MPIAKTSERPQIPLDTGVYGSLPVEGLPTPTTDVDALIAYWHKETMGSGQWAYAKLVAGPGLSINYDPDTGELLLSGADYTVINSFSADAFFAARIFADAVLLKTATATFTADAELV